ncbi:hypothetical protein WJX72_012108 [[Myrmecia] bisecta]|uniref:Small ribosomal subunit protein uS9c n=1 Tax=[Myrmecia] bisecta TaxID=41462 RepID=A0AAW1RA77_9CHLO
MWSQGSERFPEQRDQQDWAKRRPATGQDQDSRDWRNQGDVQAATEEERAAEELQQAWAEMLDAGELDKVEALMARIFPGGEGVDLPPLEDLLAYDPKEEEKAQRRAREQALQEQVTSSRVITRDEFGRAYATGKRKCSIARVWVKHGKGSILINGAPLDMYFPNITNRADVLAPFEATNTLGVFDVRAAVHGGGTTGQAQAVRHGISKALQLYDPVLRPPLKAGGLLERDSRVVERKKPGKKKARKSFQWVKR